MAAIGPLTRAQRLGAVFSLVQVTFHRRWYCSGIGCANRSLYRVVKQYKPKRSRFFSLEPKGAARSHVLYMP